MPSSRTSTHSNTRNSSRSSGGSKAQKEIIDLLKEDHKRAKKAFRDFEKLDPDEDPERCQELVEQTCAELELHATLEEELFYPAAREALDEADLIDEAEVEHMTVKRLIADLKAMTPEDEKYSATFKVLGEYVNHHVGEEEGEIFPKIAKAEIDWEDLQQQLTQRRQELSGGDEAMEEEEETEEGESSGGKGARAGGGKRAGG